MGMIARTQNATFDALMPCESHSVKEAPAACLEFSCHNFNSVEGQKWTACLLANTLYLYPRYLIGVCFGSRAYEIPTHHSWMQRRMYWAVEQHEMPARTAFCDP